MRTIAIAIAIVATACSGATQASPPPSTLPPATSTTTTTVARPVTTTTLDDGTREMLVALHTACTRLVEFIADASDTPVDISLAVDGCLQTTAEGVAQMSDETIADIAIVTGGDVECMAMLAVMASAVASDPTIDRQLVVDHVIAPLWPRCVAIIASGP